jgi:hypothetical protein
MKTPDARIALIHATALSMPPIQAAFARLWPRARCMNLLDDSLSVDRAAADSLTPEMIQRFVALARYAKDTGSHGILFSCSAFGPAIEGARAAVGIPTLKPNEAMFDEALGFATNKGADEPVKLGLVATFAASIPSMSEELLATAAQRGRRVDLQTVFVPDAMQDLAHGDVELHHAKIAARARELQGCDAVMLAQFSMADARPTVQSALGCPVLSSPDCAVTALRQKMGHG